MCSTPFDGKSKEGLLGLKLETSKAYNLVEWVFLRVTMERLGFGGRWINCIMDCVSSTRFSFIVNGGVVGDVRPS